MNLRKFIRRIVRAVAVVTAALGIQSTTRAAGPPETLLALDHPDVRAVVAVQNAATAGMMALPSVLGTAVGLDDSGRAALVIYVDQDSPAMGQIVRGLPLQIRGVGVKVELTDRFRAFAGKGPGGSGGGSRVSHTALQAPPIQLGTSGGWSKDLANGYCCGGTLGSLIQVGGKQYILATIMCSRRTLFLAAMESSQRQETASSNRVSLTWAAAPARPSPSPRWSR